MPFSLANWAVAIFPSVPREPKPPGIRMPSQQASSLEIPFFSTSSESKKRISTFALSSAPAWWNASIWDR